MIPAGSNVFKTTDGFWDVLSGSPVTGVKGNSETYYRRGNVNITASNIGLGNVNNTSDADKPISTAMQTALNTKLATNGDSKSNTVTFTSSDVADGSATAWTTVTKLASGITHATFFARVSQMFKNVRYLYKMLGSTSISDIGDGTVTGALTTISDSLTLSGEREFHSVFSNKLLYSTVRASVTVMNISDYAVELVFVKASNATTGTGGEWVDITSDSLLSIVGNDTLMITSSSQYAAGSPAAIKVNIRPKTSIIP